MTEEEEEEEEEQTPLPYATLIAVSEDAKNILHVDQTTKECEKYGAKKCPLIGPNVDVRFSNCVIGRILMAKDNETRAKTQVADLALDLPSGTFLFFCFSRVSRVRVFVFARRAHIVSLVIVFAYRFFFFSTGRFFSRGEKSAQICARRRRIRPPVAPRVLPPTLTFTLKSSSSSFLLLLLFILNSPTIRLSVAKKYSVRGTRENRLREGLQGCERVHGYHHRLQQKRVTREQRPVGKRQALRFEGSRRG